jgi:hypothetical protein
VIPIELEKFDAGSPPLESRCQNCRSPGWRATEPPPATGTAVRSGWKETEPAPAVMTWVR